jgi:hypothetical protein
MRESGRRKGGDVRRKLFNVASLVSLLLFLATVALWVRSPHTRYNLDVKQMACKPG